MEWMCGSYVSNLLTNGAHRPSRRWTVCHMMRPPIAGSKPVQRGRGNGCLRADLDRAGEVRAERLLQCDVEVAERLQLLSALQRSHVDRIEPAIARQCSHSLLRMGIVPRNEHVKLL